MTCNETHELITTLTGEKIEEKVESGIAFMK